MRPCTPLSGVARSLLMQRVMKRSILGAGLALLIAACGPSGSGGTSGVCPSPATGTTTLQNLGDGGVGTTAEVTSFGVNPGSLKMFLRTPASGAAQAVVVVLHGCTQSASDFANSGWDAIADQAGFAVVYAQQSATNNGMRCFNWFTSADTTRGLGEARSIASMTEHAKTTLGATKAYVTGLSAGAAMATALLAQYPDLFEAGAVMAGVPYGCAKSATDAFSCMNMASATTRTPAQWAALVPSNAAPTPRVSVWQGDADFTVRPANKDALVFQWLGAHGLEGATPTTSQLGDATHAEYKDSSGVVRVESWSVAGMGHGVAVSPSDGCGQAGAYFLDVGTCAVRHAAVFFGLLDANAPGPGLPGGGGSSSGALPGGSSGGAGAGTPGQSPGSGGADGDASGTDCP